MRLPFESANRPRTLTEMASSRTLKVRIPDRPNSRCPEGRPGADVNAGDRSLLLVENQEREGSLAPCAGPHAPQIRHGVRRGRWRRGRGLPWRGACDDRDLIARTVQALHVAHV